MGGGMRPSAKGTHWCWKISLVKPPTPTGLLADFFFDLLVQSQTSSETCPDAPASQTQRRPPIIWVAQTEGEEGVGDNTEETRMFFSSGEFADLVRDRNGVASLTRR